MTSQNTGMTRITQALYRRFRDKSNCVRRSSLLTRAGGGRYAFQPMGQLVFIVSRHRPKLHEYLQREFADNADVAVIVDRRLTERRLLEVDRTAYPRQHERRQALLRPPLRSRAWRSV